MISNRLLTQLILLITIVLMGYLITSNLLSILDAILGAIMLYILSRKPIHFLMKKNISRNGAEWIFLITTILCIVIPIGTLIWILEHHIQSIFSNFNEYKTALELLNEKIKLQFGFNVLSKDFGANLLKKVSQWIPELLNIGLNLLSTVGIMIILLYFFFSADSWNQRKLGEYLPLNKENQNILFQKVYSSILSNAIIIPLVALIQALVAWIGYIIAGVPNAFLWMIATFFTSMLPLVGGALIYIPLALILIFSGHQNMGIFLLVWGVVVVSSSDNFLRIFLTKKFEDTHPLITFLGVIVGLNVFGFLGLIYGPLLLSLFFILIKMYRVEYGEKELE
jgi:predicted PurR-regulated permease PerM